MLRALQTHKAPQHTKITVKEAHKTGCCLK